MSTIDKVIKIVAMVPNIIGSAGDSINERQLIKFLRKYCDVITYSLLPISNIGRLLDKSSLSYVKKDVKLELLLPLIGYPYTIGLLLEVFYGLIFTILAVFKRPKLIYVRTSGLALFPVTFKRIHNAKVVVKIPSLLEEEIKGLGNIKVHRFDRKIFERLLNILDRFVIYEADRIAVPSLLFYRELCKRRRVKSGAPPLITPPGVDLTKINKLRKMSEVESTKDEGEFTIGYIGLLEWWQGVDILVKAVHILQRDVNLRFKILIVGDGPCRNKIEVLCRDLNVRCEITGFVPHEHALKMMKRFKVLAVPRLKTSTTETNIPLKVIEAWALGVPVVITGHKILRSLKGFKKMPALFCEPKPESVAETLKLIIYNDEVVRELRDIGSMIIKQFDYDTIAKSIIEVANEG